MKTTNSDPTPTVLPTVSTAPIAPISAFIRPNFAGRRWTSSTARPILLGSSWGNVRGFASRR